MAKSTDRPAYLNPDGSVLTSDPAFHAWKHPRYLEADARLNEIKGKLVEVGNQIDHEHGRLCHHRSRNLHQEHAAAMAFGTERPDAPIGVDLKNLYQERNVLTTAVELAEKRLREIETQVSVEICKKARAAYVYLGERILPILRALAEVTDTEKAFVREMLDGGTLVGTMPAVARVPFDPGRTADAIIEEAKREYGIDLAAADTP